MVGLMACRATGLLSGNASGSRQATCTVTQNSAGARTESCGSTENQTTASKPAPAVNHGASVRLGWSDNSSNETGFVIERCDQIRFTGESEKKVTVCDSGWTIVGSVGANVTSYIDHSALANHTYLYRVKAVNAAGNSGYTDEALITAPAK